MREYLVTISFISFIIALINIYIAAYGILKLKYGKFIEVGLSDFIGEFLANHKGILCLIEVVFVIGFLYSPIAFFGFGNTRIGSVFEKGDYTAKYYVYATSKNSSSSVKRYRLPADISCNGRISDKHYYTILTMYWPNGGYTSFIDEEQPSGAEVVMNRSRSCRIAHYPWEDAEDSYNITLSSEAVTKPSTVIESGILIVYAVYVLIFSILVLICTIGRKKRALGYNQILYFNNGNSYIGEVYDGVPNGKGKLFYADGSYHIGKFQNGIPQGEGEYFKRRRDDYERYIGNFLNGKLNGYGEAFLRWDWHYVGNFLDGLMSGYGKMDYPNGEYYIGNFYNDSATGKGEIHYRNGNIYKGQVENGYPNGVGTLFTDKDSKSGYWETDEDYNTKLYLTDTIDEDSYPLEYESLVDCVKVLLKELPDFSDYFKQLLNAVENFFKKPFPEDMYVFSITSKSENETFFIDFTFSREDGYNAVTISEGGSVYNDAVGGDSFSDDIFYLDSTGYIEDKSNIHFLHIFISNFIYEGAELHIEQPESYLED